MGGVGHGRGQPALLCTPRGKPGTRPHNSGIGMNRAEKLGRRAATTDWNCQRFQPSSGSTISPATTSTSCTPCASCWARPATGPAFAAGMMPLKRHSTGYSIAVCCPLRWRESSKPAQLTSIPFDSRFTSKPPSVPSPLAPLGRILTWGSHEPKVGSLLEASRRSCHLPYTGHAAIRPHHSASTA